MPDRVGEHIEGLILVVGPIQPQRRAKIEGTRRLARQFGPVGDHGVEMQHLRHPLVRPGRGSYASGLLKGELRPAVRVAQHQPVPIGFARWRRLVGFPVVQTEQLTIELGEHSCIGCIENHLGDLRIGLGHAPSMAHHADISSRPVLTAPDTVQDMTSESRIAWLAIVAAALDLALLATLHVGAREVSSYLEPTSNYAYTPLGALVPIGQISFGLACLGVGLIWRRHRLAAALLLVVGVAKVAQAFFPIDPVGSAATTGGLLHNVLGNVAFWLLPVAALLLARPLSRAGHRATAILGLLLPLVTALVLVGSATGFFGLAQRLYLVLGTGWVLLIGISALPNRQVPRSPMP